MSREAIASCNIGSPRGVRSWHSILHAITLAPKADVRLACLLFGTLPRGCGN